MAQYTITVHNKSQEFQTYVLFASPPLTKSSNGDVFTNIYQVAHRVPSPHGSIVFTIKSAPFAVCGTLPTPLAVGVKAETEDYTPVILGNKSTSTYGSQVPVSVTDNAPSFDLSLIKQTILAGFEMSTSHFPYPNPNNIFLGYGYQGEKPEEIVPLAMMHAKPDTPFPVTPTLEFYVTTGAYTVGEVIDLSKLNTKILIDFTTGLADAVVTQNSDQRYTRNS